MTRRPDHWIARIKTVLTADILKPAYRFMASAGNPTSGHCYHAAEALWHLLGGQGSHWVPMRVRESDGMTHWWLRHRLNGQIADPTADQYRCIGEEPPYALGKGGGFMTALPSKPAKEIIRRLRSRKRFSTTAAFLDSHSHR